LYFLSSHTLTSALSKSQQPLRSFYDQDYAVTDQGTLNLTTNAAHSYFDGLDDLTGKLVPCTKNFKSAMLQGWNKVHVNRLDTAALPLSAGHTSVDDLESRCPLHYALNNPLT
jgi:hypothetical protein